MYRLFLAILLIVLPLNAAADPASDAGLTPHRALYDIELAGTRSGGQILNIDGQMLYEWQPACEGWNTNHRFNLLYEYADSPSVRIASDFSTFESFDGESLNFTSQRKRDGMVFEEIRGMAMTGQGEEAGQVSYKIPDDLNYELPPGSQFPMGHTMAMLEQLKKGNRFFNAIVFDGSDESGPMQVNAFFGKTQDVPADMLASAAIDTDLLPGQQHKAQLAFFPIALDESEPDYEMSLTFHENGVISSMLIQYEDFSVRQRLIALEKLGSQCVEPDFNE